MKPYLIAAILTPLFFASCEQKSVTVNPPDETNDTTIIKEAPATKETTTETETTIDADGKVIERKETTTEEK